MKTNFICDVVFAVGVLCVSPAALADGSISDYYFRYDFTKGVKTYENNGCETEPCTSNTGYTGVYGITGYNNAVHPRGLGSISNGDALMNGLISFHEC